jgi:hypothetical protein
MVIFILGFGKRENLFLTSILRRCEEVFFMVRIFLQVLDFLLAIEHLPAVDTEDLSVRFGFDDF